MNGSGLRSGQRFRVLATARSFCRSDGPHMALLRDEGCDVDLGAEDQPLDAAALAARIPGYDGVILGLDACDASVFDAADRLRVVSRYGAGVDAVDLDAASARGIAVTNTPGSNAVAVAELAVGLMFALARDLPRAAASAKARRFERRTGWELAGRTLGVIGYGAIGSEVAQRADALGMRVLAYDPYRADGFAPAVASDLEPLLRDSDVVSLHAALAPETRRLMNAERLGLMPAHAVLVNTSRGDLVDETALYHALRDGRLAGAALDVFSHEPPSDSPLLDLDNVIATPHLGAATRESVRRTALLAARNLADVLHGRSCPHVVNRPATDLSRAH